MRKKLAITLGLGGVIIAGIAILGNNYVSQKSDAQLIQEAILEQNRVAEEKRKSAAELAKTVLQAPEICQGQTAGFIFDYIDLEPDDYVSWPDWTLSANEVEQACMVAAFHTTNAHAFAIQGKEYTESTPANLGMANFIADVGPATLMTDGIDYGEQNASLYDLLNGFYVDRATSIYKLGREY